MKFTGPGGGLATASSRLTTNRCGDCCFGGECRAFQLHGDTRHTRRHATLWCPRHGGGCFQEGNAAHAGDKTALSEGAVMER